MNAAAGAPAVAVKDVRAGALRSEVAEAADFSRIRYSQSWEDPQSVIDALQIEPTDTVLSIAAAGDNSFALLLANPRKVVSVDMSPAQCALVELKRAAILQLEHDELLQFLGVSPCSHRSDFYLRLRDSLPARAREYWDSRPGLIVTGVNEVGRLEQYFRTFRRVVLPLTHSRRTLRGLFEPRDREARERFYESRFDSLRWRALMRLFFSEFTLGRLGRDPAFFAHVDIPSVSGHYAERTRHALVELDPSTNWFVQYILLGRFLDPATAHPYLRPENHAVLRERLDRLEVHCDELEQYLAAQQPGTFQKFNLSDIFEWMSDDLYERMLRALVRTSQPGGRLAYWNNLVPRSRPGSLASLLEPEAALATQIHERDRSFLYRAFVVERIVGSGEDGR